MSRAVTDPAMTKDAVGWGSFMGMSAALLAEAGFTGLRSQGLDALDVASLGRDWQAAGRLRQAVPVLSLVAAGAGRSAGTPPPAR